MHYTIGAIQRRTCTQNNTKDDTLEYIDECKRVPAAAVRGPYRTFFTKKLHFLLNLLSAFKQYCHCSTAKSVNHFHKKPLLIGFIDNLKRHYEQQKTLIRYTTDSLVLFLIFNLSNSK